MRGMVGTWQVDEDGSKEIEFQEFIHAIQINKAMSAKSSDESDTVDAFVALGGNVGALFGCVGTVGWSAHCHPAAATADQCCAMMCTRTRTVHAHPCRPCCTDFSSQHGLCLVQVGHWHTSAG